MNFTFCTCGSFALQWKTSGSMADNAPFPTAFAPRSSFSADPEPFRLKCLVPTERGRRTCDFCRAFRTHEDAFKKTHAKYVDVQSRIANRRTDVRTRQRQLRTSELAAADYEATSIVDLRERYERHFGRLAGADVPAVCANHEERWMQSGCDGRHMGEMGWAPKDHEGPCELKRYKVDVKDKCAKCMFDAQIVVPQRTLMEQRAAIETARRDIDRLVAEIDAECASPDAAAALAEMRTLWEACYVWLKERLHLQ